MRSTGPLNVPRWKLKRPASIVPSVTLQTLPKEESINWCVQDAFVGAACRTDAVRLMVENDVTNTAVLERLNAERCMELPAASNKRVVGLRCG